MKTRPSPRHRSGYGSADDASILWISPPSKLLERAQIRFGERKIKVVSVQTMAEASVLLEGPGHYNVVVSALQLEDAKNCEILELLADCPGTPVIALTDVFGGDFRDLFLRHGVVDFVSETQESTLDYLLEFVDRLLKNRNIHVLIVDDSLVARAAIKQMIDLLNFKVSAAKNGQEALDILRVNPDIKMVITDFHMPKMDGFKLTRIIRSTRSKDELAVIGISSQGDKFMASKFLKAGANDFIIKPFLYEELLCRIHGNVGNIELIEKIKYAANRDFLTGLLNRRHFFECAVPLFPQPQDSGMRESAENQGGCKNICASVCDIDFFKKVNDTYGHDIGDVILKHCAAMLTECFPDDLVARFGGEEFVILFQNKSIEEVVESLNGFRKHLALNPPLTEAGVIPFTISIGVCHVKTETLDEALKVADLGLYHAKEHGRDQVVVFDPTQALAEKESV